VSSKEVDMSDTLTEDTTAQEPSAEPTAEAPSVDTDDGTLAEPLIEEISIDGMCGVY
jgi:mycofactocin precursor